MSGLPLLTRFLLTDSLEMFYIVLIAGCYGAGFIFWLVLFLLQEKPAKTEESRKRFRKFWKFYFYTIVISNVIVLLLGIVTLPLGGHPPLIILSYIFSIYSISIAVVIGVFVLSATLARKVVQNLAGK
jgi:uncharacterized membrane protein